MNLPVEFLSGADADLQGIFNQFEDYREGFGTQFVLAVEAYLSRTSVYPEMAPLYFEKVRRQVMRGFPFGIFYQPFPTRILVLAILDLRRDPDELLRRLKG